MELIGSIDLLDGNAVRLERGDFARVTRYGDPHEVLARLDLPKGSRLHVVDLEGSRRGTPVERAIVRDLAANDLRVQVGGGIRSVAAAREWLECGAERVVVGTAAAESPELLRELVETFGAERIVPAVDVLDGAVRVDGWERTSATSLADVLARLEALGIPEILATDISRDGLLRGPSFALYRSLRRLTSMRVIASGGVSSTSDLVSLARLPNVIGCVVGKALLDGRIVVREAAVRLAARDTMPLRVIPCLDVRDGRVVKGVNFEGLRDSGDPVECARRYEEEGADEIVILDVSATDANRDTALDTVRRVAEAIYIPLTVGGGIRGVEDFRQALRAGADRVAINTAAVRNPQLIADCAREFGVQAVVVSVDAKDGFVMVRSGKEAAVSAGAPLTRPSATLSPLRGARGDKGGSADELEVTSNASATSAVIPSREDGEESPADGASSANAEGIPRCARDDRAGSPSALRPWPSALPSPLDAVSWCRAAESLGAGEILLTSVDRDGTNAGFDLDLLRAVTASVKISVIASGGAGALEHFRDAVETGGARAVLAASLFHDRRLSVGEVKSFLDSEGIPVR